MSAHGETNPTPGRLRRLAEEIRRGGSLQNARAELTEFVHAAGVALVGKILFELVAESDRRDDLRPLLSSYQEIASEIRESAECHTPGHPLEALRRENTALEERLGQLGAAIHKLPGSIEAFAQSKRVFEELSQVDNHYRRQEFLLFTRLECHGLDRPGRILWAAHDEVRQWLKYLALKFADDAFAPHDLAELADSVVEPLLADIQWIAFLEEAVLFPLAVEVLDETDWAVIWEHSPKIGWCLVEPGTEYRPSRQSPSFETPDCPSEIRLSTGILNVDLLPQISAELPVDLTFVDANDRVRYFSEGLPPVFYRSRAILGRDVRNCHPPRSVHYVDQILADFKSGCESSAQFWKHLGERFIHIRFVAIRDEDGTYRGTLEIAQDITHLRRLEGQKLELRYDPVEP